jgi:hypothetical protein
MIGVLRPDALNAVPTPRMKSSGLVELELTYRGASPMPISWMFGLIPLRTS